MATVLTRQQVATYYSELRKYPSFIHSLSPYEKERVYEYSKNLYEKEVEFWDNYLTTLSDYDDSDLATHNQKLNNLLERKLMVVWPKKVMQQLEEDRYGRNQPIDTNSTYEGKNHEAGNLIDTQEMIDYLNVDDFYEQKEQNRQDKKTNVELLSYLKDNYNNRKPKHYAYMLIALQKLRILPNGAVDNKTKLHDMLSKSFVNVGSRQGFTSNINRLNNPDEEERRNIDTHSHRIASYLST